jgi:hypothetical protein
MFSACGGTAQETPSPTSIPAVTTTEPTHTPVSVPTEITEEPTPTSTPLPEIELSLSLPEGNPEKGYLTAIRYGCEGCHVNEDHPESAPRFTASDTLPNIFERGEIRIASPEYQGGATTNYEYIIESILLPEAYFVPGEWPGQMSTFTIQIISDEELADILAWMETLE